MLVSYYTCESISIKETKKQKQNCVSQNIEDNYKKIALIFIYQMKIPQHFYSKHPVWEFAICH